MTRNCIGDSAYANGFPVLATDRNAVMLRTFAASGSMYFGRQKISRDVFRTFAASGSMYFGRQKISRDVFRTFAASGSMYFGRQKISRDVFQVLQHRAALVVGWIPWRDLLENHVD